MQKRTKADPNVLITGGTDGLGLELVKKYITEGANVLVTGRATEEIARNNIPIQAHYVQADQTDPLKAAQTIKNTFDNLEWSECNLAILNAGSGYVCDPTNEDLQKLDETLSVNLYAPIQISLAIAPYILTAHGQLTLIGSVAYKGADQFASYAAAKAGQHGFVRALREEWKGRANVQIIHPGAMITNMHEKAGFNTDKIKFLFTPISSAAQSIKRQISKGKSPATVGMVARFLESFRSQGQV